MGTNFEAILLSEDSTVAVVHAVSRAWDVDDKEADQEVADSKDQRHPKHPPSSCQIHEDLNQQILSLNLPENLDLTVTGVRNTCAVIANHLNYLK